MKAFNAKARRSEDARRTGGLHSVDRKSQTSAALPQRASAFESGNRKSQFVNPLRSSRLARINDWSQLAHAAKYSVRALAKACGVSVRTLERFFMPTFGHTPRHWLKGLRMQRALDLLRDGSNVSEAADRLGYKYPTQFSAAFKQMHGVPPRNYESISTGSRQTAWNCRNSI